MTRMLTEEVLTVDAILFDLDGTLIDSTPGVISAWKIFAEEYGLGLHLPIVHKTHGRRLADTLRDETLCNIQDTELLSVSNHRSILVVYHTDTVERNYALRGPCDRG